MKNISKRMSMYGAPLVIAVLGLAGCGGGGGGGGSRATNAPPVLGAQALSTKQNKEDRKSVV